jgi:hypothetical protein
MIDLAMLAEIERASSRAPTQLGTAPLYEEDELATIAKAAPSSPPSRAGRRSGPPPIPASHAAPASSVPVLPLAPVPSLPTPVSAFAISQGTPSVAPAALPPVEAPQVGRTKGRALGLGLVAAAAMAAGVFFFVRGGGGHDAHATAASAAAAPQAIAEGHIVGAAPSEGATLANSAPAPTPAADRGVDPMSLPKSGSSSDHQPAPATMRAWHSSHALARTGVAKADSDDDDTAPSAPASKPTSATAKPLVAAASSPPASLPPGSPPPANALLSVIKQEADSVPAPAAAARDEASPPAAPVQAKVAAVAPATEGAATALAPVPAAATLASATGQRPSQGQVTGALGAALPDARACLHEDDGVSRAHVVFGSDGNVQSVSVSGFAAGKPQEGCITNALKKATVPPFAEASYGATVTVRP